MQNSTTTNTVNPAWLNVSPRAFEAYVAAKMMQGNVIQYHA